MDTLPPRTATYRVTVTTCDYFSEVLVPLTPSEADAVARVVAEINADGKGDHCAAVLEIEREAPC